MKKKMRMIALLLTASMTAALLGGCGAGKAGDEAASATSEADTSAVSEGTASAESGEGFLFVTSGEDTVKILGLDPDAVDPGDTITIPETLGGKKVTAIGDEAFRGNLKIQTVSLPDTITEIGAHAFDDCSNLASINLPDSLERIGDGTFFCCSKLTELNFPASLKSIGKGAYYGCHGLTEITLPDGLTELGDYAFYGSRNITKVTFNEGLTEIGALAFMACQSLTDVTLPSTLTVIGDYAFSRDGVLVSVTFPDHMEKIGKAAFQGCNSLNHVTVTAKEIGSLAFSSCGDLNDLTLASGVEILGDECFGDDYSLDTLNLPATVKEIGSAITSGSYVRAYQTEEGGNFTAVDDVLFNQDMTLLISYPAGKQLQEYIVPDGVTAIADSAFTCTELISVILPEGLVSIGKNAFLNSAIESIEMPDTVTTLGESVFSGCMSLTTVNMSDAITELPSGLFSGDISLTNVVFPASLTTIKDNVFNECSEYAALMIPDTVTDMDPRADANSCITEFLVSKANPNYSVKDGVLFSKDGKKLLNYPAAKTDTSDYTVPEGTESIGSMAFCGTQELQSVTLADSLVTLDEASLVDVPVVRADDALTDIGENALGYSYSAEKDQLSLLTGFVLYGTSGSAAEKYADEQDLAFATGEMTLSAEELTLQMGETQTLTLANADTDHLYYFSSDENILTVDDKGVITPVASGSTYVVAAIGSKYFVCSVTVEGGTEAAKEGALPGYTELTNDTYTAWYDDYMKANSEKSFDLNDNANISLYTGDEYVPIVAAQEGEEYSHYDEGAAYPDLSLYTMVGDDLNMELSRYLLQTDMILYSGKNAHEISNYTGTGATLKDLMNSVGKTFTRKEVISTSVSLNVANGFGAYILEVYAPADTTRGMYCSSISDYAFEYELLLSGDTTYEIIGAGVKVVDAEKFDAITDENYEADGAYAPEAETDMGYDMGYDTEYGEFEYGEYEEEYEEEYFEEEYSEEEYSEEEQETGISVKPYLQVLIK